MENTTEVTTTSTTPSTTTETKREETNETIPEAAPTSPTVLLSNLLIAMQIDPSKYNWSAPANKQWLQRKINKYKKQNPTYTIINDITFE